MTESTSTVPKWRQVLADLHLRLASGEFSERFPTDREITETYQVSRHTARAAVRQLDELGLLQRGRGRGGTTVREVEFVQPLGMLYSLFQSIESLGVTQTSKVLELSRRYDSDISHRLELPRTASLLYLERVRYAGDTPLAIDTVWLPFERSQALLEADFSRTSLYSELQLRCGITIDSGSEEIRPYSLRHSEAVLLGVHVGDLAFEVLRIGSSQDHKIEFRRTLIRGDRSSFSVAWNTPGLPNLTREGFSAHYEGSP